MVKSRLRPLFLFIPLLVSGLTVLPVKASHITNPAEITRLQHLVERDNLVEADRQVTNLLNYYPDNPDLQFLHALIADRAGDADKAMTLYQQLIRDRPGMLEPYNNLALLQARQGHYRAAIDTLERAIRSKPEMATVYSNLTALFGRLASEAYQKALDSDIPVPPLDLTPLDTIKSDTCHCANGESGSMINLTGEQADPPVDQSGAGNSVNDNEGITDPATPAPELPDSATD